MRSVTNTGTLVGFAKVTRDLTEKRAADERLRRPRRWRRSASSRGASRNDFNNLLTAIVGNLELLAATLPAQERAQRYAACGAARRVAGPRD